jgi:hypothetical protein
MIHIDEYSQEMLVTVLKSRIMLKDSRIVASKCVFLSVGGFGDRDKEGELHQSDDTGNDLLPAVDPLLADEVESAKQGDWVAPHRGDQLLIYRYTGILVDKDM